MISEFEDDIIEQLKTISGITEVDLYVGDVEDIIKQPHRMPALHVLYQGGDFLKDRVIGSNQAKLTGEFLVILTSRNVRSTVAGAGSCYSIIESVRSKLIGHVIGNNGYLWPVSEDLLFSKKGILCYGLKYEIKTGT